MTKNNSKAARESRRAAAEKRQAQYDALSLQDKIDKAYHGSPGESKREIARLNAQAEKLGWSPAPEAA